jgi:DNA-binding beta-propeller fold protein YncE
MSTVNLEQTRFLKYSRTVGMTTMRGRGFYYPVDSTMAGDGRIYVVNRSAERTPADTVRVTMLNMDGEYFGVFGSKGSGDGEFLWPCGIAVDGDGRVYVSDEQLHRITRFTASGEFVSSWGTNGSGDGELDGPSGIAFDPDDNILVSDARNHRIQRFTKDGVSLSAFGAAGSGEGELDLPWGLTTNADGDVFVADWGNDRVQRFSPDGRFVAQYGGTGIGDGQFVKPASVAVDADGYIYVADWGNERVQVLDPDGRFVQKLRGESTLSTWAEDFFSANTEEAEARGRADLEKKIELPVDTPHEESSHIEKYFWGPASVMLDSDGRLLVTESHRHRLQVFERGG